MQFQKAVQLRPEFLDAYESLGTAYAQIGQIDEARANLQIALSIAITSGDAASAQRIKEEIARLSIRRGANGTSTPAPPQL